MSSKSILSVRDVREKPSLQSKVGGKFYGLCEAVDIIEKAELGKSYSIKIPKSWVISSKVFDAIKPAPGEETDKHFDNLVIPDEVIRECKQIMALCGGKIALRSSANIEDGLQKGHPKRRGKMFSGACDSLLGVKVTDIREGLKKIYKSLYNPVMLESCEDISDLKMSVIIQQMIKPKIAGVIYSRAFENEGEEADASSAVIHYVENDTADRMIVGKGGGKICKVPKYLMADKKDDFSFCDIHNLSDNQAYVSMNGNVEQTFEKDSEAYERAFQELAQMELSALVSHFEMKLGHPVDMEFAVTADAKSGKPVIYVLQQRPYWPVEDFKIRNFDNETVTGYHAKGDKEIQGEVLIVEAQPPYDFDFDNLNIPDLEGKIVLLRRQSFERMKKQHPEITPEEHEIYMAKTIMMHEHIMGFEYYSKAKALIDGSGKVLERVYGHSGNELGRNGVPFVITNNEAFKRLDSGDNIILNFAEGNYKREEKQPHNGLDNAQMMQVLGKVSGRK